MIRGPYKSAKDRRTKNLHVYFTQTEYAHLKALCEYEDMPLARFVREVAVEYLKSSKSPLREIMGVGK